MLLAHNGAARAAISVPTEASWLERHAADELRNYLHSISGAWLPIGTHGGDEQTVVAVGKPCSNPLVRSALDPGLAHLLDSSSEEDVFVVQSVRSTGRDGLVLAGGTDRATLYAVYGFLEEVLDVGFFRDGEYIPHLPTIELPAVNIVERPRFSGRLDGNGCMFNYTALTWGWEEWRRELDWKAKRRVNMNCPFLVGEDIVHGILVDWGAPCERPTPLPCARLHERAFAYARQLGMRVPCVIPDAKMPDAFFERYPNCRTMLTDWSGFPPTRRLHPADPMFHRFVVEYLRRYNERYGSDHYYIAHFLAEDRIVQGGDDRQQVWLDYAKAMSAALQEADSRATWLVYTWSFDMDASAPEQRWTSEQITEYLNAITVPIIVCDLWAEEAEKYKRADYFDGKPWAFSVLYTFGGNSYLHGDVPGLINRVRDLDRTVGGKRCTCFMSEPEMVDFNSFYLELVALLSWSPDSVTLNGYVAKYCRRRYGEQVAKYFEPVFRELLDTVYGPESGSVRLLLDPFYWFRPTASLYVGSPRYRDRVLDIRRKRAAFIPRLRHAIELLLEQSNTLRENPMALRDLVDIARQWIAERFYQALRRARDAFARGDSSAFEESAAVCASLLDQQVRLLASWPPYRLDLKIDRAKAIFGEDACRAVKHGHVWVFYDGHLESPDLRDYYRMDLDGLVADYYRPRVKGYLDLLRRKLAEGDTTLTDDELEQTYSRIEREFVAAPLSPQPRGEDTIEVVRHLLVGES